MHQQTSNIKNARDVDKGDVDNMVNKPDLLAAVTDCRAHMKLAPMGMARSNKLPEPVSNLVL